MKNKKRPSHNWDERHNGTRGSTQIALIKIEDHLDQPVTGLSGPTYYGINPVQ